MSETTFIENAGSCIATAQAIEAPGRIRWMLRTPSAVPTDSGWRFYADEDDEENMAHTTNMRVVDFNRIAELEPIVAEVYAQPVGSDFEIRTLPDGGKQVIDSATGAVVAGQGAGDAAGTDAPVGATAAAPAATEPGDGPAAGTSGWNGASGAPTGSAPTGSVRAEADAAASGTAASGIAGPTTDVTSGPTDPDEQDRAVAAGAVWLRPAVQQWLSARTAPARTGLLSELFGAQVLVPFQPGSDRPASFTHHGQVVVPLHTSRHGALAWQERLGAAGNELRVLTGDAALRAAFGPQGANAVVLDPVEVGVEIHSDDEFLVGYSRNGELKRLVRSGDKQALLNYLVSDGASGVYLYDAQPGEPAYPMLVTRQGTGEREFALFSSALEVFRYQGQGSAAEIGVEWIRRNLAQDMYLCIDPGADGGFVEFSPADLAQVGFRLG